MISKSVAAVLTQLGTTSPTSNSVLSKKAGLTIAGSGLGLAIVTEILQRHHSTLEIESHTEGETGTYFRFNLPLLSTEEAA